MSNRYSKTGFTSREDDRLRQLELDILRIIELRSGKNDSEIAISRLFRAQADISDARYRSKRWKESK